MPQELRSPLTRETYLKALYAPGPVYPYGDEVISPFEQAVRRVELLRKRAEAAQYFNEPIIRSYDQLRGDYALEPFSPLARLWNRGLYRIGAGPAPTPPQAPTENEWVPALYNLLRNSTNTGMHYPTLFSNPQPGTQDEMPSVSPQPFHPQR